MHPNKVSRERLHQLTDLPNIGQAMAKDLCLLGIRKPQDLLGCDAYDLYDKLCVQTGQRHDPCVIDVFLSVIDFMNGAAAKPWWAYTAERKAYIQILESDRLESLSENA